mmetsp:Transcript_17999/g.28461  ORF Transcript_17999/g.28461 Transcript_17999/m.28461 type:complete len:831 (+) Transcript_17999:51-2543(+)|eukprot:CAMPEP_0202713996 /NCGR_PEP_ID=MMETSP1385-20130828/62264_1 /ASSEMBLY_ACC=CAM_ASM_000861 /TAXON_ID=933848 /ORGANISM="Elphidium margaritaceum" /LENGTH=830 /DNA_ID=CAMNT_0049374557 /DNA_START=49 /DNA_END=2541 /DNA_ORIENTATION=-
MASSSGYYYEQDTTEDNGAPLVDESGGIVECSPSFMDTSMYYFPSTSEMQKRSHLDFGVVCQPLQTNEEIPLINFSGGSASENGSVVRCRSCRAYINPFVEWLSNGMHHHWVCNLCGISNEVHSKAYVDRYMSGQCQELQYASVEIVAPEEYCVRPPQLPAYLFVINVSKQSMESNVVAHVCNTLKQLINDDQGGGGGDDDDEEQAQAAAHNFNRNYQQQTQVGFITYSDKVHFYSLKATQSKPKMFVTNDVNDAVLPIPANQIMTDLRESHDMINELLDTLPLLHGGGDGGGGGGGADSVSSENALGTAIECGFTALKEMGGKMVCFSFGLPSLGKGKAMNRTLNVDMRNHSEYDKLLKRSNNFYMDLAISMTKYQISCDLFQFTSARHEYVDVSTIKGICRCSGGQLFLYDAYDAAAHGSALCSDVYKLLTRETAWETVMRLRCSRGVSIKHYYGCFYRRSADLLSVPAMDCDKTITVLLTHTNAGDTDAAADTDTGGGDAGDKAGGGAYINAPYIYVQSALLYTNSFGQRRIRCCTKRIAVSSSYPELYHGVNLSAMTALIAKQAVFKMLSKDVASSRMFIQDACLSMLEGYCRNCNVPNGLPTENDYIESLRFLPLNTLGLLRSAAFVDIRDAANNVSIDTRIAVLTNLLHMNHANIEVLIRPSLYRIDELVTLDDDTLDDEYYLPTEIPLTRTALRADGMYVLDNGQCFVVRIGQKVALNVIQTFFVKQTTQKQTGRGTGGSGSSGGALSLNADMNHNRYLHKLHAILQYLQSINYRHQCMDILYQTQSDKEKAFCSLYLIRDRSESVMTYDEFLTFIYKNTRPK